MLAFVTLLTLPHLEPSEMMGKAPGRPRLVLGPDLAGSVVVA